MYAKGAVGRTKGPYSVVRVEIRGNKEYVTISTEHGEKEATTAELEIFR